MIRRPDEFNEDFEIETDVVVVGAGPGGAAAAYKLSALGHRVVVVETGGYYTPGDFKSDGLFALKNLYQDGGSRFTHGNAFFSTMFGKGVGGGSLVNSAISFRTPHKAVERWREEAGLKEFTSEKLKPYLDEVEQNVNIEVLDVDKLGRNNTIFKDGLEKLGYRGAVIPRCTKNCIACARCFFGCPSGAKQSVDKNFIASAMNHGTDVYIFTKAVAIDVDAQTGKFRSLLCSIVDPESQKTRARVTFKAKHLILSAGAVGTPQLLLRDGIANSSGQVGKNFRCHPSTGVIGVFEEPIDGFRSVVQGFYSDQFFDQDVLLETGWAPAGILAAAIPGFGKEATDVMKDVRYFALAGGMIREESSGSLEFSGQHVEIEYNINVRDQKLLTLAMYHSAEVLMAAGAKVIYADNPIKSIFTSMDDLRAFFARVPNLGPDIIREGNHGMGTCRMGENPKTSVVDSFGLTHDIGNLWIHDVSNFPSALGVNPSITIMALALRGAEYMSGNFS